MRRSDGVTGLVRLLQVTQVKQERSTADPGRGVDGMFEHVIVLTKMDKRESKQVDHVVGAGASRRRGVVPSPRVCSSAID